MILKQIILFIIIIFAVVYSLQCDEFCTICDHQAKCIECQSNWIYNSYFNTCQYNCPENQFFSEIQQNCVYKCEEYYIQDHGHKICRKQYEIPNLSELRQKNLEQKIKGLLHHYNTSTQEITLITYGGNLFLEYIYPQSKSKKNELSDNIVQLSENLGLKNEVILAKFTENQDYIIGVTSLNYVVYWNFQSKAFVNMTQGVNESNQDIHTEGDNSCILVKNNLIFAKKNEYNTIYRFDFWANLNHKFVLPSSSCTNHIIQQIELVDQEDFLYSFGDFIDSSNDKFVIISKINILIDGSLSFDWCQTYSLQQNQGDYHIYIGKHSYQTVNGIGFIYQDFNIDESFQQDYSYIYNSQQIMSFNKNGMAGGPYILPYKKQIDFLYDNSFSIMIQYQDLLVQYSNSDITSHIFTKLNEQKLHMNTIVKEIESENVIMSYNQQGILKNYTYSFYTGGTLNINQNCEKIECDYDFGNCPLFCGQGKCCKDNSYSVHCSGSEGCTGNACCIGQNFQGVQLQVQSTLKVLNFHIPGIDYVIQDGIGNTFVYQKTVLGYFEDNKIVQVYKHKEFQKELINQISFDNDQLLIGSQYGYISNYNFINQDSFYDIGELDYQGKQAVFSLNYRSEQPQFQYFYKNPAGGNKIFQALETQLLSFSDSEYRKMDKLNSNIMDSNEKVKQSLYMGSGKVVILTQNYVIIYDIGSDSIIHKLFHSGDIQFINFDIDNQNLIIKTDQNVLKIMEFSSLVQANHGQILVCQKPPTDNLSAYSLDNITPVQPLITGRITKKSVIKSGTINQKLEVNIDNTQKFGHPDFSICFWLNLSSTATINSNIIDIKYNNNQSRLNLELRTGLIVRYFVYSGGAMHSSDLTGFLEQAEWMHICIVVSYTTQRKIQFYKNSFMFFEEITGGLGPMQNQAHEFIIGRNGAKDLGQFDDLKIFNRILSIKEIQCLADQEFYYYDVSTGQKEGDQYPKPVPFWYFIDNDIEVLNTERFLQGQMNGQWHLWICRIGSGDILQFDGILIDPNLYNTYNNNGGEKCNKLLKYENFGSSIQKIISVYEDNSVVIWNYNQYSQFQKIGGIKGDIYDSFMIEKALFTFSFQFEKNSYFIQEWDITNGLLKNTITSQEKLIAQSVVSDKYAVISFKNGQRFYLHPKNNGVFQQFPQDQSFSANTQSVIIMECVSEYHFILADNQIRKVLQNNLISSFTLHSIGGNSVRYMENASQMQLLFYNSQSLILFNIDTDTIQEILINGIQNVIAERGLIIILTTIEVYLYNSQDGVQVHSKNFGGGKTILDFCLHKEESQNIFFVVFDNGLASVYDFQNEETVNIVSVNYSHQGIISIGDMIYYLSNNQIKIYRFSTGEIVKTYEILSMQAPLLNYGVYEGEYLILKNALSIHFYKIYRETYLIFMNKLIGSRIPLTNMDIYENDKTIVAYHSSGVVYLINYGNIYALRQESFSLPSNEYNKHIIYDSQFEILLQITEVFIYVWDSVRRQIVNKINHQQFLNNEALLGINLNKKNNLLMVHGTSQIVFFSYYDSFNQDNKLKNFDEYEQKSILQQNNQQQQITILDNIIRNDHKWIDKIQQSYLLINDEYVLSYGYIRLSLFDLEANLLDQTSPSQINIFKYNVDENIGFLAQNTNLKKLTIDIANKQIQISNLQNYSNNIQKLIQISQENCILVLFRNEGELFLFNYGSNSNQEFVLDKPNYQDIYYEDFMGNSFLVVKRNGHQVLQYEINGGVLNPSPLKRISLNYDVEKVILGESFKYLFVVHKEVSFFSIYDFSGESLEKQLSLPYNEDCNVHIQINLERILVFSPFQINIYNYEEGFPLLNSIRNKKFNEIQECFLLQNINFLSVRTNNYIYIIRIEEPVVECGYNYEIMITLYYPGLKPTKFNVDYIDDETVEIELQGVYNEQLIVDFKKGIYTDKTRYYHSFYNIHENTAQYQQFQQLENFLKSNLNSTIDMLDILLYSNETRQVPVSINNQFFQVFNQTEEEILLNNHKYGLNQFQYDLRSLSSSLFAQVFPEFLESIEIKNLKFIQDLEDIHIQFENKYRIWFQNLTFEDISIENSTLFTLKDTNLVVIKEFYLYNNDIKNTTLFNLENINELLIEDLIIEDNLFKEYSQNDSQNENQKQELFKLESVQKITIKNVSINRNMQQFQFEFKDNLLEVFNLIGCKSTCIEGYNFTHNENIAAIKYLNLYENQTKIVQLNNDFLNISTSLFYNNTQRDDVSMLYLEGTEVLIQNCTFKETICENCLGTVMRLKYIQFQVENCLFQGNQGYKGSCFYVQQCQKKENLIKNNTYLYNSAFIGGVIYIENSELQAEIEYVSHNSAHLGSFMFFKERVPDCLINIQNRLLASSSFIFIDNIGILSKNEIETQPSGFSVDYHESCTNFFSSYVSGQSAFLEISFYNSLKEKIDLSTNSLSKKEIQELQKEFDLDVSIQNLQSQVAQIESFMQIFLYSGDFEQKSQSILYNLTMIGIPNYKTSILFTVDNLVDVDYFAQEIERKEQFVEFEVEFDTCQVGQIVVPLGKFFKCVDCIEGTFSSVQPTLQNQESIVCRPCPRKAYTCFKDTIIAQNGYWMGNNSYIIKDCLIENNCIQETNYIKNIENGISKYAYQETCRIGSIGTLCDGCDYYGEKWGKPYFKDALFQECIACEEQYKGFEIIKFIIKIVLETWYIQFCVRCAIKMQISQTLGVYLRRLKVLPVSRSCFIDITTFHIKQFFHYMILQKIATLGIPFEAIEGFQFLMNIFSSPIMIFYNSFDCLLNFDKNGMSNVFFLRGIYSSLIPLIYFAIVLWWLSLLMVFKKIEQNLKFFFTIGVFLLMYLFPGIVNVLIQSILCREMEGKYYIVQSLQNECMTEEHMQFVRWFALPLLTIWSLVFPLVLFLLIKKMVVRGRSNWYTQRIKYGFLIGEFKLKYYYWGFVKIYKNLVIVTLMAMSQENLTSSLVILFLVLFVYLTLIHVLKPYKMIYFNQKDYLSMALLLALISMNLLQNHYNSDVVSQGSFVIISLVNQIYFYHLFFMIVYYRIMKKFQNRLKEISVKIGQKLPFLKGFLKFDKPVQFITLKRWLFLQRRLKKISQRKPYGEIERYKDKEKDKDIDVNLQSDQESEDSRSRKMFCLDSPLFSDSGRGSSRKAKSSKFIEYFSPRLQKQHMGSSTIKLSHYSPQRSSNQQRFNTISPHNIESSNRKGRGKTSRFNFPRKKTQKNNNNSDSNMNNSNSNYSSNNNNQMSNFESKDNSPNPLLGSHINYVNTYKDMNTSMSQDDTIDNNRMLTEVILLSPQSINSPKVDTSSSTNQGQGLSIERPKIKIKKEDKRKRFEIPDSEPDGEEIKLQNFFL